MNKKIGNIFKGDKVIWMVFFFLCMISIVEVFSASSNLTYKSQNYIGPIAFHTVTIVIGALVAVVTLNIPCRYFKLMTPFLLIMPLFQIDDAFLTDYLRHYTPLGTCWWRVYQWC